MKPSEPGPSTLGRPSRRPIFPPAPAIPVPAPIPALNHVVVIPPTEPPSPSLSLRASTAHWFSDVADLSGSLQISEPSSSLDQYSPILDHSREVLYPPSPLELSRVHHPADDVFLRYLYCR